MAEIESDNCYSWILKNQDIISFMIAIGYLNNHVLWSFNSQDMICQVNIYVVDIVWILCDAYA